MDIRMYLDGIYVFDKNATLPENAGHKWYLIMHGKLYLKIKTDIIF
jgi:hypothetical protein